MTDYANMGLEMKELSDRLLEISDFLEQKGEPWARCALAAQALREIAAELVGDRPDFEAGADALEVKDGDGSGSLRT
jgi:hypothetical protein